MITENFSVKNIKRLVELQSFIRNNMPTCRFNGDPIKFNNGSYLVTIQYEIVDINKICVHHNEWYDIDNITEIHEHILLKYFNKIKNYFNKFHINKS